MVRFRDYAPDDRDGCLTLFDANCPEYFDPSERESFVAYLAAPAGRFAVLAEDDRAVVGCGGVIADPASGTAHLVWGMIAPTRQRSGLGRRLALERLGWIAAMPEMRRVAMDTSQKTVGFYERLGFTVTRVMPDGYGPGLSRVDLELILDPATRDRVALALQRL